MSSTTGNLISSIGLYKKNLIFYIFLVIMAAIIYYLVSGQVGTAEVAPGESNVVKVLVARNGAVTVDGKKAKGVIKEDKNKDVLNYKVLDSPGIFLDKIKVVVELPNEFISGQIKQRVYAVSGVDSYRAYSQGKTLVYEGYGIGPAATFSIAAELPKGMVVWPFYRQVISLMSLNSFKIWVTVGIAFPLITLLILMVMLIKTTRGNYVATPSEARPNPPSDLPPAIVGVLVNGKISTREIAATLLDLADRKFITIYSKSSVQEIDFSFGQREPIELHAAALRDFELVLLSKIFEGKRFATTRQQFIQRLGRHLFSRKIAEVYLAIYQKAIDMGYFIENPLELQQKYKTFGYLMLSGGLLGFVLGIFLLPDPKFLLLFWAGMIFSALAVISLSGKLPSKTPAARAEIALWLAFRKFLCEPSYLKNTNLELFEKYLPYAIVLRCELAWMKRFHDQPLRLPAWYDSTIRVTTTEDFATSLFSIIGFVGRSLSGIREPTVE